MSSSRNVWKTVEIDESGKIIACGHAVCRTKVGAVRFMNKHWGTTREGCRWVVYGRSSRLKTTDRKHRRDGINKGIFLVCPSCNKWEDRLECHVRNRRGALTGNIKHKGKVINKRKVKK